MNTNRWISAKWLGRRYTEKIKANPHIPLQAIRKCVDEDFSSTLSRMKAYVLGSTHLRGYLVEREPSIRSCMTTKVNSCRLILTPPLTSCTRVIGMTQAKALDSSDFTAGLGPLKRGWRDFCRPVVFLDACFLKGAYKGQLFTAIGMDQNDGWWPIAWGVAEAEGYIQWKWFLELLDVDLQLSENSPRYVFMSDQQKVHVCYSLFTISINPEYDILSYIRPQI